MESYGCHFSDLNCNKETEFATPVRLRSLGSKGGKRSWFHKESPLQVKAKYESK
jgi:hypothetical protein